MPRTWRPSEATLQALQALKLARPSSHSGWGAGPLLQERVQRRQWRSALPEEKLSRDLDPRATPGSYRISISVGVSSNIPRQ